MNVLQDNFMKKLDNIHEKCIRLITINYIMKRTTRINSLTPNPLTLHQLPHESSLSIFTWAISWTTDIFTLHKNPQYLQYSFDSENPWSMGFGVDAIACRSGNLWQKVQVEIENCSSPKIFKAKIKPRKCDICPDNLCKRFVVNLGDV